MQQPLQGNKTRPNPSQMVDKLLPVLKLVAVIGQVLRGVSPLRDAVISKAREVINEVTSVVQQNLDRI